MTGTEAQGYAGALDVIVGVLERIFKSEHALMIILALAVIALAIWVWHLSKHKINDLLTRLTSCETRHDACEGRERKNMIAIATLHGVVCQMQEALPQGHPLRRANDQIKIPSLTELLSGDPAVAAAHNREIETPHDLVEQR